MAADVLIIGSGVIGASLACELAGEGLKVLVLDRKQPAAEATWAAAGMLAPVPEGPESDALVPLERSSLDLYPEFIGRIEAASGIRTGFRRTGALVVWFGPHADHEQGEFLAALARFDLGGQPLTGDEALRREPTLNPAVAAGVWLPQEASLDNRTLGRALAIAGRRVGVELRCGVEVTGLLVEQDQCRGVVASGERIAAGQVVVAAGCFSGRIGHVGRYAPTRPIRGQMVALDAGSARPSTVLRSEGGYLVPREDGRLIAGSTLENAGFDKSTTPKGLRTILAGAMELVPALAGVPILETWCGLRPDSPDHLPMLGPTDLPGLSIATGHYRNGVLLAPITARLACQWLTGKPTDFDLGPFSPLRFAESADRLIRD